MVPKYSLLKSKEVLSILDGDKDFGEYNGVKVSLPYLSGPMLCDLSTAFGLPVEYGWSGGSLSRWVYLDNLLAYCIERDKVQQLLAYLFAKDKFAEKMRGLTPSKIDNTYQHIIKTVVEQINGQLYFGGHELVIVNKTFIVKPIDAKVTIEAPKIKIIDRDYIKTLAERAKDDIDNSNYDSAVTKCRTLVEEVFCYVIELKGQTPSESGDITSLYKQVKGLYNMHQSKEADKRINVLLSGLEKILTAIAEMRNKDSDAHGVGSKRLNIEEHHARLLLNSAIAMSDFILAVAERNQKEVSKDSAG